MCGFVGARHIDRPVDESALLRARDTMLARGPDDAGVFVQGHVGLAHRRLAVIDLSEQGRMPMTDPTGAVWVVFNGEIYNHHDLRARLEVRGHRFRGRSDSEAIVHGYLEWGVDLFEVLDGMFAIAIWDARSDEILLARDPAGEKPLYYHHDPASGVLFGSTLDALLAWDRPWKLDPAAAREYLSFGFVRAPRTIVQGIQKVLPGSCVTFPRSGPPRRRTFWSLADEVGRSHPSSSEELEETIHQAVVSRMESDVPLGAFLSGGVDSSLVCAMMARENAKDVRTFTIGFDDPAFDESVQAREIAGCIGVQNTTLVLTEHDVLSELPNVIRALDEPMADYSIFPTLAVSRLAREELTVALTGDGADELFGGYRYYSALRAFTYASHLPHAIREPAARLGRLAPDPRAARALGRLGARSPADFFGRSGFYRGATIGGSLELLLGSSHPPPQAVVADFVATRAAHMHVVEAGMLWDATHTLPEAWLCKVDRAAMSVSLETRAPLLAKSVQRAAVGLGLDERVRVRERKVALRQILRRYLPKELVDRPKQGFTPPMARWMRTSLAPRLRGLAAESFIASSGLVSPRGLSEAISAHLAGAHDHAQALWAAMLLEEWAHQRGFA